jgi:hypothetical protein
MGCAGMSAHISKGPVHRAVDWVVNHQNTGGEFDMRQRFLDDLESNREYLDILNEALRSFLRKEGLPSQWADKRADFLTSYLADYWYGAWWPQHQPVMPLVRVGLIKAIHVANMVKPRLPIESHWVTAGPADSPASPFEVIVTRGDQQVTRLLLTPETPMAADPRLLEELADVWIVKRGPVGTWEVEEAGELGQRAITTRLKAYPLKMPQARIRDGQQQYTPPPQNT